MYFDKVLYHLNKNDKDKYIDNSYLAKAYKDGILRPQYGLLVDRFEKDVRKVRTISEYHDFALTRIVSYDNNSRIILDTHIKNDVTEITTYDYDDNIKTVKSTSAEHIVKTYQLDNNTLLKEEYFTLSDCVEPYKTNIYDIGHLCISIFKKDNLFIKESYSSSGKVLYHYEYIITKNKDRIYFKQIHYDRVQPIILIDSTLIMKVEGTITTTQIYNDNYTDCIEYKNQFVVNKTILNMREMKISIDINNNQIKQIISEHLELTLDDYRKLMQ